ncbi:MAG TPA: hypothetical protein VGF61_19535 [Candidatus Acidoferrum sp.]
MSQSSLVNSPGNFAAFVTRRSTRIEKSVPLIVLGKNRMGEPFMERTVSVTVNKHGCLYPSRHDHGVGTWVTLQLVGLIGDDEKPQIVRAMVRSIHPPASFRELQQVGVELETPANVWGIEPAPVDWTSAVEAIGSTPQLAAVVAPAPEPGTKRAGLSEVPLKPEPEPKMGDVTKTGEVTSISSRSPATSRPTAPDGPEAPRPQRVVVTADGLISALQGRFQQEAEKAVQVALEKQVNDRIRDALRSIDDARRLSVSEVQELVSKRIEEMKLPLKEESAGEMAAQWKAEMEVYRGRAEEVAQRLETQAGELRCELANTAQEYVEKMTREIGPQIPARLNEAVCQATSDFESAIAVVLDRRYELLLESVQIATQEALAKLNARSAEVQALAQSALNSSVEEFQRETERHVTMALAETKKRAVSALASLDAESRAACDARREALEAEVSRSAERAAEEFRKGMKELLYSCLGAAVGAEKIREKFAGGTGE